MSLGIKGFFLNETTQSLGWSKVFCSPVRQAAPRPRQHQELLIETLRLILQRTKERIAIHVAFAVPCAHKNTHNLLLKHVCHLSRAESAWTRQSAIQRWCEGCLPRWPPGVIASSLSWHEVNGHDGCTIEAGKRHCFSFSPMFSNITLPSMPAKRHNNGNLQYVCF